MQSKATIQILRDFSRIAIYDFANEAVRAALRGVAPLCPASGYAAKRPNSFTYGRGACGVCNRFSRNKGHGAVTQGFELPDHHEVKEH